MHPGWNIEWQTTLRNLVLLIGSVLIAELAHYLLYMLLRLAAKRRGSFAASAIVDRTSRAGRLLLLLVAFSAVRPQLTMPGWLEGPVLHVVEIGFIVGLAWLATGAIEVFNSLVIHRLPADMQADVRARRIRTQIHLLRQMAIGAIVFGALAAALMTFPSIRNIGEGLFASAGLAGLAVGMAARPALANLIAGMQIALTEPIRIGDAVVVEREFGWVQEVNTTYVVVRLWDLRHLVVPLSYFIEKPFQNWTRYTSDLIGVVFLYIDYTAPVDQIREEYRRILQSSPLWDGKVAAVQVTDIKEQTIELRFLMSASNPSAAFDLRCYVREKLIDHVQREHPHALPRARSSVALVEMAVDKH